MGTVTFLSPVLPSAVTIRFSKYERPTLLNLAQSHGIPLRCDCRIAGCGKCAVKVAAVRPSRVFAVRLNTEEKKTLWCAGKLTAEQYQADTLPASSPLWRLACRYIPSGEDVWVAF